VTRQTRPPAVVLAIAILTLVLAACGRDAEHDDGTSTGTLESDGPRAAAFPVTIEHRFGDTTIGEELPSIDDINFEEVALDVVSEGRTVYVREATLAGAMSYSGPKALLYALDTVVPELAAAADGDPATEVGTLG
jgi:hypothetical protein